MGEWAFFFFQGEGRNPGGGRDWSPAVCSSDLAKAVTFFVFDTDTGKVVTKLPCTAQNDDMWRDLQRKRIYVTGTETTRSEEHTSELQSRLHLVCRLLLEKKKKKKNKIQINR